MNNFTVTDVTLDRLPEQAAELAQIFNQHGVLHLRKLLLKDETFEHLVREIKMLTVRLLEKTGYALNAEQSLERLIRELQLRAPTYPAYLYDMLTRPMKLVSGNLLKHHPGLIALARHIFGAEALVASPFQSDNFLMVPPGAGSDRFVLPIHQDFPYQMQSAEQITYWMSLSEWSPGVGGLRVWPGSHRLGLRPCHKNVNGHYEVQIAEETLARYQPVEIVWNYGDLLVIHGLALHQALPNQTLDRMRLVQIFRYSNVNTEEATAYFWQSNIYTRRGMNFAEVYPDYDLGASEGATSIAAR